MSLGDLLAQGRAAAEAIMTDTCTVRQVTGETTDEATGQTTPTYTTLYSGRCRVQQSALGATSSSQDAGEAEVRLLALVVQLPVAGTEGIPVGAEVVIDTATYDADLVGREFLVQSLAHKSHATSRRLGVIEATS